VVGAFSLGVYPRQNDTYKKMVALLEKKKTEPGTKD
jgi:hypothetical protein